MKELERKAQELQELRRMREELDAEIESITDTIKAIMGETEEIAAGPFRITWKTVTTSRIDTAALKKAMPDIAAQFSKASTTRRFTII